MWTGFDYRGEPTPYRWPCINSHFGILDTCGFPKDNFYYYQSWWTSKNVLHLVPHRWSWPDKEGKEIRVDQSRPGIDRDFVAERDQMFSVPSNHRLQRVHNQQSGDFGMLERRNRGVSEAQAANDDIPLLAF